MFESIQFSTAKRQRKASKLKFINLVLNYLRLFDKTYGEKSSRKVPAHTPYVIDREIMGSLWRKFPREFEKASSNRFRGKDDMQYQFAYYNFIIEEGKWPYEIDETFNTWRFVGVDFKWNVEEQLRNIKNIPKKFLCLNDHIDYYNESSRLLIRDLNLFYAELFPYKSQFEI